MGIGSNYTNVESISMGEHGSRYTHRVHHDNFLSELTPEPNAEAIIAGNVDRYQHQMDSIMGRIKETTARLGVVPMQSIEDRTGDGANALAVVSSQVDTDAYKNALILAKKETLPALFEEMKHASSNLTHWMKATSLPMMAAIGPMKDSIEAIDDRIYTIELYAGLTEDAVKVRDGDPAQTFEKLRVMQRRLYMDEECLANYTAGGIDIKSIGAFDQWIAEPENFERLLPFPRCMVAFRVRRFDKDREVENLMDLLVNIQLQNADKFTYLYIRNGEQVWRVTCNFEFEEKVFPDIGQFDVTRPQMVKMFAGRVDQIMDRDRWEFFMEEEQAKVTAQQMKHDAWNAEQDPAMVNKSFHNPHRVNDYKLRELREYEPLNPTNVYFDEASKFISDEIKKFNRVAIIIQGLFDRSLVLHPHPPVQVWHPSSMIQSLEFIYDATFTLSDGEKPDFEAYRAKLNALIGPDSIVTGQEDFWRRLEAIKENARIEKEGYDSRRHRPNYKRLTPSYSDGPGLVSNMTEWKVRAKKAVFRFVRNRGRYGFGDEISTSVDVPVSEILNVSAYTPGDYKMFLSDHRTRQEYIKWAYLLLAAEDYHAGKLPLNVAGHRCRGRHNGS
jgi:hypothetical protein